MGEKSISAKRRIKISGGWGVDGFFLAGSVCSRCSGDVSQSHVEGCAKASPNSS